MFDVCLMNPPYDGTLHLRFLDKVTKIADTIVSIEPVRWLEDPFAFTKKTSTLKQFENVAKHIEKIDKVLSGEASKNFNIALYSNLAIYTASSEITDFKYKDFWKSTLSDVQVSIIEKICFGNKTKSIAKVLDKNAHDGVRVPISVIAGGRGCLPVIKNYSLIIDGMISGEKWNDVWNRDKKHKAFQKSYENIMSTIKFDSENEARNFYDSYFNFEPLKGLCELTVEEQNIQIQVLPFFDDYSKPITEDYLKKIFDLTDDEINELKRNKHV